MMKHFEVVKIHVVSIQLSHGPRLQSSDNWRWHFEIKNQADIVEDKSLLPGQRAY
jgi:hypothetical protein